MFARFAQNAIERFRDHHQPLAPATAPAAKSSDVAPRLIEAAVLPTVMVERAPPPARKNELVGLTYVRGVAAIWVVVFHMRPHLPDHLLLSAIAGRGYLAVDMFFVLSGFVLAFVYSDQLRGWSFSFRDFLLKRLARLYPVHLVMLLVMYGLTVMGSLTRVREADLAVSTLAILPSALGVEAWGVRPSMMLNFPSWSISAEFFVYLGFPVLFALASRLRPHLAPGLLCLLVCLAVARYGFGANVFQLTAFALPRVVPEFLCGIGLYLTLAGWRTSIWPVLPVLAIWTVAVAMGPDLAVVIASGLLIGALYTANRPLSAAPIRWLKHLGVISYSVYMVHIFVATLGFKLLELAFGYTDNQVPVIFIVPMLAVTLLAGHVVWRSVEQPGHRLVMRLSRSRMVGDRG